MRSVEGGAQFVRQARQNTQPKSNKGCQFAHQLAITRIHAHTPSLYPVKQTTQMSHGTLGTPEIFFYCTQTTSMILDHWVWQRPLCFYDLHTGNCHVLLPSFRIKSLIYKQFCYMHKQKQEEPNFNFFKSWRVIYFNQHYY